MPTSIELFAGGGGLALGLHLAGFEHLRLIEWEAQACKTLRLNAGKPAAPWAPTQVEEMDVRDYLAEFNVETMRDVDLVAGGPPCQPFSLGGLHAGHNDARNMFPAALDVVRELAPKFVIFENVPGLMRPSFAAYFDYVLDQLARPGVMPREDEPWQDHWSRVKRAARGIRGLSYEVGRQVILAADLGVPQMRRRVFCVGIRSDLGVEWRDVTLDHTEDALLHALYVSGAYWDEHADDPDVRQNRLRYAESVPPPLLSRVARLRHEGAPGSKRWRTVRDSLRDPEPLPPPRDGVQVGSWPNHVGVPGARAYPGHTGSDLDLPSKTIKAGVHGVCGGEAMIRHRDGSLRYMTVREAARIQGFPDWYEFAGARSHAMRHIGNAVAVGVGRAVGEHLRTLTGL